MEPPVTMNMLETLGLQASQLKEELAETFPPVNPSPQDSIQQIMYRAGQRSVVEWFLHKLEE